MSSILLQAEGLTPVQRAVRDQFDTGGSLVAVVLVLVGICAAIYLAQILSNRLNPDARDAAPIDDPQKLFGNLLSALSLPARQTRLLKSVARDLGMEHPTAMLISPVLFDRAVKRWNETRAPSREGYEAVIPRARLALFPREP